MSPDPPPSHSCPPRLDIQRCVCRSGLPMTVSGAGPNWHCRITPDMSVIRAW
jgi:hypothetical protein